MARTTAHGRLHRAAPGAADRHEPADQRPDREHQRHQHEVVPQQHADEEHEHADRPYVVVGERADHGEGHHGDADADEHPPHRAPHREPADPLGLQDAGPVRGDQPRRVAVVGMQGVPVQAQRDQGERIGGQRRRRPSSAGSGPARLQRLHDRPSARSGSAPTSATRSRSRTPVQVPVALQPSTQVIGRSTVCCGRAASVGEVERRPGRPARSPRAGSRPRSPMPAAAAVRLTGSPCGPRAASAAPAPTARDSGATVCPIVARVTIAGRGRRWRRAARAGSGPSADGARRAGRAPQRVPDRPAA